MVASSMASPAQRRASNWSICSRQSQHDPHWRSYINQSPLAAKNVCSYIWAAKCQNKLLSAGSKNTISKLSQQDDDDDVYYYIRWRLELEGETENMGVCTKERKGITAEVLMATPCTNSLGIESGGAQALYCLLYTSPSPRDRTRSRMPSSA